MILIMAAIVGIVVDLCALLSCFYVAARRRSRIDVMHTDPRGGTPVTVLQEPPVLVVDWTASDISE